MKNIYRLNGNIYIVSHTEKIKENTQTFKEGFNGDWYITKKGNLLQMIEGDTVLGFALLGCKKVILTTDPQLIADGVKAIDNTFLEWFCENSSCENVEVEELCGGCGSNDGDCWRSKECNKGYFKNKYKIIIPKQKEVGEVTEKGIIDVIGKCGNCGVEFHIHKDIMDEVEKDEELQKFDEEVKLQVIQTKEDADIFYKELENPSTPNEKLKKAFKKQETLEEAAKNYLNSGKTPNDYKSFIEGANWQAERMYSEEETYRLLHNLMSSVSLGLLKINDDMDLKAWFNKNKK